MIEKILKAGSVKILKNQVESSGPLFVIKVGVVDESRWTVVLSAFWHYMQKGNKMTIIIRAPEVTGESIRKFIYARGMNDNSRLFTSLDNLNEDDIKEEIIIEAEEAGIFFAKSRAYVDGTVFAVVNELKQYFEEKQ